MEHVIFNNDLKYKVINSGNNGTCYLTKDNDVFKNCFNVKEKDLEKLSKYYSNFFVFPKKVVLAENGILLGYIMDYVEGTRFDKLNRSFSMEKYIKDIKNLEYEVARLSLDRVNIMDASIYNVLLSNKDDIKVIDTDFYRINNTYNYNFSRNLHNFSYTLLFPFIDLYGFSFKSEDLNKYLNQLRYSKILISNLFEEFSDKLISMNKYSDNSKVFKRNLRKL